MSTIVSATKDVIHQVNIFIFLFHVIQCDVNWSPLCSWKILRNGCFQSAVQMCISGKQFINRLFITVACHPPTIFQEPGMEDDEPVWLQILLLQRRQQIKLNNHDLFAATIIIHGDTHLLASFDSVDFLLRSAIQSLIDKTQIQLDSVV